MLLGSADVVVNVLEVDVVQDPAPLRQRACEEVVERLVPELAHPGRLVLVLGDRLDDLVRDAAARLEEVVLRLVRVGEAVLVLLTDLLDGFRPGRRCHQTFTSYLSYPSASSICASSGPPSSTIRPSEKTCTKSGLM